MIDPAAAPEDLLADAFGMHVAHWARSEGAATAAAQAARQAAALVSRATSEGRVCVDLAELAAAAQGDGGAPIDLGALRQLLMDSKTVGSALAPDGLPLILDGEDRLYLHRYFDYQQRLARSVAHRSVMTTPGATRPGTTESVATRTSPQDAAQSTERLTQPVVALLARLFPGAAPDAPRNAPDWQQIAVITALLGRLTIISGGPGTGKTTAIVNLLACLLADQPDCRIALAAPTGKAAARIVEAIRERSAHLPAALRAALPTESSTIHRLLGMGTRDGTRSAFRHDAGNRLPIDVLIVDEASMLDLALAVHLVEAVPDEARIILLGDKDQLAAVESGAVFAELSAQPALSARRVETLARLCGVAAATIQAAAPSAAAAPEPQPTPVDGVIWLRRNYRFAADSPIGLLAAAINAGDAARVLAQLANAAAGAAGDATAWLDDGGDAPSPDTLRALLGGYGEYLDAVRGSATDPGKVTHAFGRFRVLCAVRDGPRGVDAVNRAISQHCRRAIQHPRDPGLRSAWYPGLPVMVQRNDYVLKLFNGDIGIVLPDAHGDLAVYFPDEAGGYRSFAPVRLPEHEIAFATTVHKSQGSEFDEVLLLLPSKPNRVLVRELLYTAVTRARRRVTIAGSAAVVAMTVQGSGARRALGATGSAAWPNSDR